MRKCLRFTPIVIMMVAALSGCRSDYRELKAAYSDKQYTDYYYEEISRVDALMPKADDAFLSEINTRIEDHQSRWQKKMADVKTQKTIGVDSKAVTSARAMSNDALVDFVGTDTRLDKLVAVALARNPVVAARRAKLNSALQRFPQATTLDTILNQYNAFTKELNTKVGPMNHKQMVDMAFPAPGTLALKGNVLDQDVFIALKTYDIARRDLVTQVKSAYFTYDYLHSALKINRENQKLLEDIIAVTQTKYQTDRAKYSNVIMAQVELAQITNSVITLEQDLATVISKLNTLMDLPVDTKLGPPADEPLSKLAVNADEVHEAAMKYRQEIQIETAKLKRFELMIKLAGTMTYPDPSLGHAYFEADARPATPSTPGDSFSQKTLSRRRASDFGRRDAYVKEMEKMADAQKQNLESVVNDTRFTVKKALFTLDASRRSLNLHNEVLLPQANQALKAGEAAYRTNKIEFITYIDAQRTLLRLQLGKAAAKRGYQTALAELDQLAGIHLPRTPMSKAASAETEN